VTLRSGESNEKLFSEAQPFGMVSASSPSPGTSFQNCSGAITATDHILAYGAEAVLKDTTLGQLITYDEVVRQARGITLAPGAEALLIYALVALVFILINYSLGKLAEYLERRLSRRGERAGARLTIEPGMGAGAGA